MSKRKGANLIFGFLFISGGMPLTNYFYDKCGFNLFLSLTLGLIFVITLYLGILWVIENVFSK